MTAKCLSVAIWLISHPRRRNWTKSCQTVDLPYYESTHTRRRQTSSRSSQPSCRVACPSQLASGYSLWEEIMDWEAIGAIGEVGGAIAVVATLLLLYRTSIKYGLPLTGSSGSIRARSTFWPAFSYPSGIRTLLKDTHYDQVVRCRARFCVAFLWRPFMAIGTVK